MSSLMVKSIIFLSLMSYELFHVWNFLTAGLDWKSISFSTHKSFSEAIKFMKWKFELLRMLLAFEEENLRIFLAAFSQLSSYYVKSQVTLKREAVQRARIKDDGTRERWNNYRDFLETLLVSLGKEMSDDESSSETTKKTSQKSQR